MTHPPTGLMEAFWSYERALMANDLAALDRLFAPGPHTLRGDSAGLLVGHDQISAFRGARGGAPRRTIVETHVQAVDDDHALVIAVTELARGGRGQQTQLWQRADDRWVVTAAHVAAPAPALDTRVWRVVGDPLVRASHPGPLSGQSVAVKDLYAVAGHPIGAGSPAWAADAPVEAAHATVVARLLDAGADLRGIARTDELAYSLAGTSTHFGTPPNPRAPHRISGGSTSGSASAVSLGHASVGLGTDTGGSIRVPASYQGLFGIRTTHGAVPLDGALPLAPTFDTVGWLTRDAALLARVGDVLLPPATASGSTDLVVVPALVGLAQPDVAAAVDRWAAQLGATTEDWDLAQLPTWLAAFQTLQAHQAWRSHGDWVLSHGDAMDPDVRARFENGSRVTRAQADDAARTVADARSTIRNLVGERVLVLPATSSVAPRIGAGLQAVRDATMRLTCLAGLGGLPAVSIPITTADGLPCGVCLVAAPGRDRDLLALTTVLAQP